MKTFIFCFLAACVASLFIIPACSPSRDFSVFSDSSISPVVILPEKDPDIKQGGGSGGGG